MNKFYEGMAEIFEVEPQQVDAQFDLAATGAWDSLALVSTIALVDDCFNVMLDGASLSACATVGDIEALVEKARKE
jgi:acyl carrier protein